MDAIPRALIDIDRTRQVRATTRLCVGDIA